MLICCGMAVKRMGMVGVVDVVNIVMNVLFP